MRCTPAPTRRAVVVGMAAASVLPALAGGARAAAQEDPEVTSIRLVFDPEVPNLCFAPQYLAEEFLRLEGFTEIRYVDRLAGNPTVSAVLAADAADISATFACDPVAAIDRGEPVTLLGGLHPGCVELFASDRVASIRDLRGKRILTAGERDASHLFLASVLAYIGLDPQRDVEWVLEPGSGERLRRFSAGEADLISSVPPMNFELRRRRIGHVILNTTVDDPWRHLFCCMIAARRDFVRENPVATKRVLRAIYKANELCDIDRETVARRLAKRGVVGNAEDARAMVEEVPYGAWQSFDPAATVRFFALRMREVGLITRTPAEILEIGTDFGFLDNLKRELKT